MIEDFFFTNNFKFWYLSLVYLQLFSILIFFFSKIQGGRWQMSTLYPPPAVAYAETRFRTPGGKVPGTVAARPGRDECGYLSHERSAPRTDVAT
jgi:hypothetical protein